MTAIEWTHRPGTKGEVWNPVTGCAKVSAGCKHCYAETIAGRFWATQYPAVATIPEADDLKLNTLVDRLGYELGISKAIERSARPRRFTDVLCHEDRLDIPLRWRQPRTVFVNSMSDLFHEAVPDAFIDRVFSVMALCPQHTFIVLTKRPVRMRTYANPGRLKQVNLAAAAIEGSDADIRWWPLPNVWLGVSVEDQATADARIPLLLQTPAAVRVVSVEPLLSGVDLSKWLYDNRRNGVLGAGGNGIVQYRPEERINLATGEMDRRRARGGAGLCSEDESRAKLGTEEQLSPGAVQGWRGAKEGERPPCCVDGGKSAADTAGDGGQPSRRRQAEQRADEPGTSDTPAERPTLPLGFEPEEEGPARREKLQRGADRVAGDGDPEHLEGWGSDPTRDCSAIRHRAVGGVVNRASQELDPPLIAWLLIGGESGPKARPCDVAWIRSLVQQARDAGVPCFVKQLGAFVVDRNDAGYEGDAPGGWPCGTDTEDMVSGRFQGDPVVRVLLHSRKGADPSEWPEDLRAREWPA